MEKIFFLRNFLLKTEMIFLSWKFKIYSRTLYYLISFDSMHHWSLTIMQKSIVRSLCGQARKKPWQETRYFTCSQNIKKVASTNFELIWLTQGMYPSICQKYIRQVFFDDSTLGTCIIFNGSLQSSNKRHNDLS